MATATETTTGDWVEHTDDTTTRTYYVNKNTGASVWENPAADAEAPPGGGAAAAAVAAATVVAAPRAPAAARAGGGFTACFYLAAVAAVAAGAAILPPDHDLRLALPASYPVVDPAGLTSTRFVDVLASLCGADADALLKYVEAPAPAPAPAPRKPRVEAVATAHLPKAQDVAGATATGGATPATTLIDSLRYHQKKTAAAFSVAVLLPLYAKIVAN